MLIKDGDRNAETIAKKFYQYNERTPPPTLAGWWNAVSIDLNLLSLYRLNGQEQARPPGLLAFAPPRKTARGRERNPLLVSLLLNGNAPFAREEYEKLAGEAAAAFHNTHGALTAALRAAAESVNRALLERNLSTTGRGQYAIGWLTLAALRETSLTVLQCGPTHAISLHGGNIRHLHDPALAGKGLGLSQSISQYFSQIELQPGDRLLLCPKLPPAWEGALASDRGLPPIESTRKRMMALVEGDVNGALIHVTEGTGKFHIALDAPPSTPGLADSSPAAPPAPLFFPPPSTPGPSGSSPASSLSKPAPAAGLDSTPAHVVGRPPGEGPSAYAIPPQPAAADEALVEQLASAALARQFPPSIPRAMPPEPAIESAPTADEEEPELETVDVSSAPRRSAEEIARRRVEAQRRTARAAVGGLQAWRGLTARVGAALRKFLPHLLPGGESDLSLPLPAMALIALVAPLIVVTIGVLVYMRFGVSSQYDFHLAQAQALRQKAMAETDPVLQREAWTAVQLRVAQAETYRVTPDTAALRQEAQARLDALLGVTRLQFRPAFNPALNAQISRMAASDSDLYMLDAARGEILRAAVTGRGYEFDLNFDCKPGVYGNHTIGSLVDLQALPRLNTLNSSALGVDAAGNLLYCAPGQTPTAFPLTPPATNWGRVTGMALDGGRLFVLDAPARAVWIYTDKDGVYVDPPLLFFGAQIPEIQDAIDIAVSGDELYLLHADGRLTHCIYSRIETVPTRCDSPAQLANPFPAYGEMNVFGQAHYTQLMLTGLPDPVLLLLDAEGRSVHRLGARGFELQAILDAAAGSLPAGQLGAMAFSPSRVLYLADGGQVYFTAGVP